MNKGHRKYRLMMGYLDSVGFMTSIDRISKKQFTFLINGTATHTYKCRHSCNVKLEKLYNQQRKQNNHGWKIKTE